MPYSSHKILEIIPNVKTEIPTTAIQHPSHYTWKMLKPVSSGMDLKSPEAPPRTSQRSLIRSQSLQPGQDNNKNMRVTDKNIRLLHDKLKHGVPVLK